MILELKHVAPYLPYELKVAFTPGNYIFTLSGINPHNSELYDEESEEYDREHCKLLLHPLSDLTKEIEYNGEKFIPLGKLHYKFCLTSQLKRKTKAKYDYHEDNSMHATWYPIGQAGSFGIKVFKHDYGRNEWRVMRNLLKWHFDVFGLIDEGMAIDINTIKQ